MDKKFHGILLLSCLLATACNTASDDSIGTRVSTDHKSESFAYEFKSGYCTTGRQTFKSQDSLCAGLQSNALNNDCAADLRAIHFKSNCPNQSFKAIEQAAAEETGVRPVAAAPNAAAPVLAPARARSVQITALNFLNGGFEQCDVKNKIFSFSFDDNGLEQPICENSKVKVFARSGSGVVTLHTIDLATQSELPAIGETDAKGFELGKLQGMLRYQAQNPYGFTYLMAEDVTGIDPAVLAHLNLLNSEAADRHAKSLSGQ